MAIPRKLLIVPNAATRELWRVAESGELDELFAVLPQADINGRNEHGMTALMRAARQGRVQMVRALLEYGADPNLKRNDNFTALSLAAFFGHTEIVEMLLNRGAQTDVETRNGTSPKMWATARSFGDVARSLERPPTQEFVPTQRFVPAETVPDEPVSAVAAPIVVRTLKDPPEIWDLVHEAPRNFNAGSAFLTRLSSMRTVSLIGLAALFVAVGLGTAAMLKWKGLLPVNTFARRESPAKPATAAPVAASPSATTTETAVAPTENINVESTPEVLTPEPPTTAPRRYRSLARSRTTPSNVSTTNTIESAQPPPPPTINLKVDTQTTNDKPGNNKTTAPLSPQMISPPKSSQPKAKVIQWP